MKPSVGRIVHYHLEVRAPLAALVVGVFETGLDPLSSSPVEENQYLVNLLVFSSQGVRTIPGESVPFSHVPKVGHWTWPPRV